MQSSLRSVGRSTWASVRAMALFTVLLGVVYALVITGIGQLALPWQANGSLRTDSQGNAVGSALIGQSFVDATGAPLPEYFQPRPSAAGDGYDGGASGASNLGPENPDLVAAITERKSQVARFNGVPESAVPADAVTASASGLDPHISQEYAAIQVARVAQARHLDPAVVQQVVAENTHGRALGYLGESTVNVLDVNIALTELKE
ncbi:potassium-transporting ATPase subunit KdpC [Leucobacter sp. cx-328]|uniref:potassium-transporting ATPase subunit KdpC n=1 Tax=unclassified Leucobacter TaxID=2621730 RepID=UPI00165DFD10|nr:MULTISPECIES: potassium-transporting ATPase subunit KdpC [unclassified Leucobacter]MBC9944340.1 potassium-transporting ATPase subunit KdpC [Leucobacter sp. cx-328]